MANNASFKPNEGKREEFRRYLEKTGVMDALTKVLVLLYEEADKPDDALKFILNALARQTGSDTIDDMQAQIRELQDRISQLENSTSEGQGVKSLQAVEGLSSTGEKMTDGAEEAQENQAASNANVQPA